MPMKNREALSRRDFLLSSAALGAAGVTAAANPTPVLGRAEHCIFIWLGGGMGQIDTVDPNVGRGPGFLGPRAGYVYLTDTSAGPAGFTRAADVDGRRQAARERLLGPLRQQAATAAPLAAYDEAVVESLRLAGPQFMR